MNRRDALLRAGAFCASCAISPSLALAADEEQQIGQQVFDQLRAKGQIIDRPNPLYDTLDAIAAPIKRVADPQYNYPFQFVLVRQQAPNAFSVPGGNIYVTDSLMRFISTKEELAGVLSHETSHAIHHDVINNIRKEQNLEIGATVLSMLFGRGQSTLANQVLGLGAGLQTMNFTREIEHNADHKGAYTAAQAGYNPYGMVWLFQKFDKAGLGGQMEMLSDHPTNSHRVADLQSQFAADPQTFGRFSSSTGSATPLHLPASG